MIRRTIHRYVVKTHHWRDIGHSELSELYASMAIRTVAISMVGVFLPIYLFNLGYSLHSIVGFFLAFSLVRIPANFLAGYVVGKIGPKHSIIISTILNITYMCMLLSLESINWPIYLMAGLYSTTNAFFYIAYHTDFSKVKHVKHAGKEYSHMLVVQKIGAAIGPLVGGLIAGFADIRISIGIAASLLIVSLVPLFLTKEPVRTHQHVSYKGLARKLWLRRKNVFALTSLDRSGVVAGTLWPFYIALTIFADNAYQSIGLITTAAMLLGIFTASAYGRMADGRHPRILLRSAVAADGALGLSRLFIDTPTPAIAHNLARAQSTSAREIPFIKGYYDEADEFPGQRIAYIVATEFMLVLTRSIFWIVLLIAMSLGDATEMLRYGSVVASIVGLFVVIENYRALNR